jgi:hypothetical protein
MHDRPLLDVPRLTGHRTPPETLPVFRDIGRDWAAGLEARLAALSETPPADMPAALHELRSGATAIGMPALAARAAALEQAAEGGRPPSPGELAELGDLARRSALALLAWWETAAGPVPPA